MLLNDMWFSRQLLFFIWGLRPGAGRVLSQASDMLGPDNFHAYGFFSRSKDVRKVFSLGDFLLQLKRIFFKAFS